MPLTIGLPCFPFWNDCPVETKGLNGRSTAAFGPRAEWWTTCETTRETTATFNDRFDLWENPNSHTDEPTDPDEKPIAYNTTRRSWDSPYLGERRWVALLDLDW